MEKIDALVDAQHMLDLLLKTQPNLLVDKGGANQHNAEELANFCADFVETLAERLMNR